MSVVGVSPEVNKFKQVFSGDNQTSVAIAGRGVVSMCGIRGRGGVGVGPLSGI